MRWRRMSRLDSGDHCRRFDLVPAIAFVDDKPQLQFQRQPEREFIVKHEPRGR